MMEQQDTLEVLVIGAGFSGICAGIKLLEAGITRFRIYEKSDGVGGTWWENTYPGAACDVASHLYCFSFEPNPDWSRMYSPQPEIQAYLQHCLDKYGLRSRLCNNMRVVALQFDDSSGLWQTQFADGSSVMSRHVINGSGGLHVPKLPDIPGVADFAGKSMHSAQWDKEFDPAGKRIAVIGSAASAIQLIPVVAQSAVNVTVFQRTPNFIAPRMDRAYSANEKARFRRWPWLLKLYRLWIFLRMEWLLFPVTREKSRLRKFLARRVMQFMRSEVRDPSLHRALTPAFELGCKRILISDDFYASLNRDNVQLVCSAITRIEAGGIRTADGVLHEADTIVYATGFDLEAQLHSFSVTGPGGQTLAQQWADIPEAYNGCCIAGMPNLWLTTGPNTGVGTTSVVFMVERIMRFILECIEKAGESKLIAVTEQASRRYNNEIQDALQHTVWASGCHSWYRREDGRIATLYPWSAQRFSKQLARVDFHDFDLRKHQCDATQGPDPG